MCEEFLAHPGEPSTKPIEWCVQILDDLTVLEASRDYFKREALANAERLHKEQEANARLKQPVADEEMGQFAVCLEDHMGRRGWAIPRDGVDALLASRSKEPKGATE